MGSKAACYFEGSLQVMDAKDLKFTAYLLIYVYIYESRLLFEGLVTYSKVKRINRGYVTHYTIKLTLRDQDYSNIIIEGVKDHYCYYDKRYPGTYGS